MLHQVRNIRTTSHAAPSCSASCFHSRQWSPSYPQDPSPSLSHQKPLLFTLNDISINSSFSPPPFLEPRYLTISCNSDTSNFSRREGVRICQRVPLSTGPVSSGSVCFAETCFMCPRPPSNRAAGDDLEHLIFLPECQNYRCSLSGPSVETRISCIASSRPLAPNTSFNIVAMEGRRHRKTDNRGITSVQQCWNKHCPSKTAEPGSQA